VFRIPVDLMSAWLQVDGALQNLSPAPGDEWQGRKRELMVAYWLKLNIQRKPNSLLFLYATIFIGSQERFVHLEERQYALAVAIRSTEWINGLHISLLCDYVNWRT